MSSFRGLDLFGSGPHRVLRGSQKQIVIPLWVVSGAPADDGQGSFLIGDKELFMTVRGRLVASSESALWTLREALAGEATYSSPTKVGALVDNLGHSWADLVLIEYEELGPVGRGRVWSMRYEATMRRVSNTS